MEFGNIGNYYIIEPFFRLLHDTYPNAKIKTTMQLSQRFCDKESVQVLPMDLYYGWKNNELQSVKEELIISEEYKSTGKLSESTPYIDEVLNSDLVVDFSGDLWGDNADLLGNNRFEIGLLKDKIAQNLGKKVVMLAGSPGPFTNVETKSLSKNVYQGFNLVTNREPISTELLRKNGFDLTNTKTLACPAFLFAPSSGEQTEKLVNKLLNKSRCNRPVIGFILCGWNFVEGPFDKWPRSNEDYLKFAELIEYMTETLQFRVCLMSHSNGFDVPVVNFKLKHGRDYVVIKQLERVLLERGISKHFYTLDGVYDTWDTKAILGSFDMLISGRIHAAVASLSQYVPTVIIDYGHEPKAHKLQGFAKVAGVADFIANPNELDDLKDKVNFCWKGKNDIKKKLQASIPQVKNLSRLNFELLKELL